MRIQIQFMHVQFRSSSWLCNFSMEAQTVAIAFATSLCEGIDPTTCMPTQHAAPCINNGEMRILRPITKPTTCEEVTVYRKLPKIRPPFLHTTVRQKWGGGVCSNIQFVSCIRPLPPFLVVLSTRAQIRQLRRLPRSFAECVTTGNQRRLC